MTNLHTTFGSLTADRTKPTAPPTIVVSARLVLALPGAVELRDMLTQIIDTAAKQGLSEPPPRQRRRAARRHLPLIHCSVQTDGADTASLSRLPVRSCRPAPIKRSTSASIRICSTASATVLRKSLSPLFCSSSTRPFYLRSSGPWAEACNSTLAHLPVTTCRSRARRASSKRGFRPTRAYRRISTTSAD